MPLRPTQIPSVLLTKGVDCGPRSREVARGRCGGRMPDRVDQLLLRVRGRASHGSIDS
jgi:hypothetical protein